MTTLPSGSLTRPGLTVNQTAELLNVKASTVRVWIHRGKITRDSRGLIEPRQLIAMLDREPVGKVRTAR